MVNRKLSAKIAAIFLVLHGRIERPAGIHEFHSADNDQFRRIDGPGAQTEHLGDCHVRRVLGDRPIGRRNHDHPSGVTDTLFAILALIFLLYAWFGDEVKESLMLMRTSSYE